MFIIISTSTKTYTYILIASLPSNCHDLNLLCLLLSVMISSNTLTQKIHHSSIKTFLATFAISILFVYKYLKLSRLIGTSLIQKEFLSQSQVSNSIWTQRSLLCYKMTQKEILLAVKRAKRKWISQISQQTQRTICKKKYFIKI